MRRPTLITQLLAMNSTLIALTVLATAAAGRLDVTAVAERRQYLVIVAGVLATVLVNGVVLRRRLEPLHAIIDTMEHVDLSEGGLRAAGHADTEEVARLHAAFNRMMDRLEQERTEAADAVLRAQEDERARLARDLHDEVNQALTAVLLRLQATTLAAPPELAEELRETQAVATQAMGELRRLAHELRPTALDDLGLAAALRSQVDAFGVKAGIDARLQLSGNVDDFREDEQLVVYRVVQEALSNAARHAEARHITVSVRRKGARGVVQIADDGRGIDPQADRGHGLAGMRERARQAGGRLDVQGTPGGGTTIELELGRTVPTTKRPARRAWA
ncbi:MAG: sensor histidine kinase [Solirubrobacterales bacterium]|jgi:two-component system sensor histidine kinase UhpB|nr:sensor histidine kinase [Solirubrobacterales bacterium]